MRNLLLQRLLSLRAIILPLLFYVFASTLAQTMLDTIVSYIVSLSNKTGQDFSNTVNEIASQYVLFAIAIGASIVSFTIAQADRALYRYLPFWNDGQRPIWQLDRVRKEELLRGLSNGALLALVYLVFFSIAGQIGYLGIYITSTFGTPIFPLFFLDVVALVTLLACEEFLFRHKILRALLQQAPPAAAIVITSVLHTIVRHIQFQLDGFDHLNLFLVNLALGYLFLKSGKCQRGLGFLLALFGILHSLSGLAIWGVESPSFFLFKSAPRANTFISGGGSGPLGGAGISVLLVLFALGSYFAWKRELALKQSAERQASLAR